MAEIRTYPLVRHLRAEPSYHVLHYRRGVLSRSGRGLAFFFRPLATGVAEVPVADLELPVLVHGRSADFQDVTVQGIVAYRVVEPEVIAQRIDFSIDLATGAWRKQPLDRLTALVAQLVQQIVAGYLHGVSIATILSEGMGKLQALVAAGLPADAGLRELGIEIVAVRIASVKPTADLEKALQAPTREAIQQKADQAAFERRAEAVDKERAIQENELANQIELARRESDLIGQRGQNERRRAGEEAEARRITADADAARAKVEAGARAESLELVEGARVEAERGRIGIYRDLPAVVLLGLAARELAGKLEKIEHLTISPDALGPILTRLAEAGARRLEGRGEGAGEGEGEES